MEHMWILSNGRRLFETANQWKINIGPGKYNQHKIVRKPSRSGWSKDIRFNYEKKERKEDLGPASYKLGKGMINRQQVASSAFNSKSSKSHLEEKVMKKIKWTHNRHNPEYLICKINETQIKSEKVR